MVGVDDAAGIEGIDAAVSEASETEPAVVVDDWPSVERVTTSSIGAGIGSSPSKIGVATSSTTPAIGLRS